MAELSSREVVERFAKALRDNDLDMQDALLHDDVSEDYPQSGELIRGKANRRAIIENYPGAEAAGLPESVVDEVVGSEDRWVVGPSFGFMHFSGTSDHFVGVGHAQYPDGTMWHIISLIELRDGKISHITSYFAQDFDPPAWRSQWVGTMPVRH
jgi:ketosteroid isomerase-like protein